MNNQELALEAQKDETKGKRETRTVQYTNSSRKGQFQAERNTGKRITKSAGYVPIADQIRIMQDAGVQLEKSKAALYDFQDGAYSFETDPTRRQGFDLAEASELERASFKQITKVKREAYLRRQEALGKIQNDTEKVSIGDTIIKENISPEQKPEGGS